MLFHDIPPHLVVIFGILLGIILLHHLAFLLMSWYFKSTGLTLIDFKKVVAIMKMEKFEKQGAVSRVIRMQKQERWDE